MKLKNESIWKSSRKEILKLFGLILIATFVLLFAFRLVPEELKWGSSSVSKTAETKSVNKVDDVKKIIILPTHISIPAIGVDVSISNPQSDNVEILDSYLTKGAVRYPGSGDINSGNMFLFAHSTGFKIVQNQAYKAFNNLKSLVSGDEIIVSGEDGQSYIYKVTSVKLASSEDVLVRFDTDNHIITLSTCNTFGKKEERYVVEATYVGKR